MKKTLEIKYYPDFHLKKYEMFMISRFIFFVFVFLSWNAFSSHSCKGVFKDQEKREHKEVQKDQVKQEQKVQNILETDSKFLDKKYSLAYLKNASQILSISSIMNTYSILDKEDQLQMLKHYQKTKDERSYWVLYFSHFKLVAKMAHRYKNIRYHEGEGMNYDDYFQEGLLILSNAIKEYDFVKNNSFLNYASLNLDLRLKKHMKKNVLVRNHVSQKNVELQDVEKEFTTESESFRSKSNIEKEVTDDIYLKEIKDWTFNNIIKKKEDKSRKLWRYVAENRMFTNREPETLKNIAKKFKITTQRVKQIESQITDRIIDEFTQKPDQKKEDIKDKNVSFLKKSLFIDQKYLKEIKDWTLNRLKKGQVQKGTNRDLWIAVAEGRVFVSLKENRVVFRKIAERFNSSISKVARIELNIIRMIESKIKSDKLRKDSDDISTFFK